MIMTQKLKSVFVVTKENNRPMPEEVGHAMVKYVFLLASLFDPLGILPCKKASSISCHGHDLLHLLFQYATKRA